MVSLPGLALDSGSHSRDGPLPGMGGAQATAAGGNPETPAGPRERDRAEDLEKTLSLRAQTGLTLCHMFLENV